MTSGSDFRAEATERKMASRRHQEGQQPLVVVTVAGDELAGVHRQQHRGGTAARVVDRWKGNDRRCRPKHGGRSGDAVEVVRVDDHVARPATLRVRVAGEVASEVNTALAQAMLCKQVDDALRRGPPLGP